MHENNAQGNKGYLKMTIAATQHSKSKMNRDILEYSLAQSNTIWNLTYIGQIRKPNTATGETRAIMGQTTLMEQQPSEPQRKAPYWRKTK